MSLPALSPLEASSEGAGQLQQLLCAQLFKLSCFRPSRCRKQWGWWCGEVQEEDFVCVSDLICLFQPHPCSPGTGGPPSRERSRRAEERRR